MSAVNNRKLNEPSTKEKGREMPSHEPSMEEREHISAQTGKKRGDLEKE